MSQAQVPSTLIMPGTVFSWQTLQAANYRLAEFIMCTHKFYSCFVPLGGSDFGTLTA